MTGCYVLKGVSRGGNVLWSGLKQNRSPHLSMGLLFQTFRLALAWRKVIRLL